MKSYLEAKKERDERKQGREEKLKRKGTSERRKRGRNEDGGTTKHKEMKTRDVQSIFCLISEMTSL